LISASLQPSLLKAIPIPQPVFTTNVMTTSKILNAPAGKLCKEQVARPSGSFGECHAAFFALLMA
jgi:hypothetical protein